MILAIDAGNTHTVIGCIEGDNEIKNVVRLATDTAKTGNEYAVLLRQLLQFEGVDYMKFEGAILSSVVPPLTGTLSSAVKMLTGHEPLIVGAGVKTGLNILIDNPAQLGSDLVIGAVAALAYYKPPVIVIDLGTATKISVIDEKSSYIGCAIAPGIGLSLNALVSGTSQLPKVPVEAPKSCIGTNTVDSIKSGVIFGAASMLDGMVARVEEELGHKAEVVVTGGLSGEVAKYCRHPLTHDENLLIRGLSIIYHKNKKK